MREIKHHSVHQWIRFAIPDSQQPTSPIGFLFLKLPPPPCAVLLVEIVYMFAMTSNVSLNKTASIWLERDISKHNYAQPKARAYGPASAALALLARHGLVNQIPCASNRLKPLEMTHHESLMLSCYQHLSDMLFCVLVTIVVINLTFSFHSKYLRWWRFGRKPAKAARSFDDFNGRG